ncbi:MAG TPA: hypothetical protein VN920_17440 [Pyrinomonadaceae bacterium]|nr:hypothetical protein [Pyrinomonadaceae bacterium]
MDKKPTIQELEKLLNSEEDTPIQILPNGEIRAVGQTSAADLGAKKPLTMKEDLGGEYGRNYGQ